MAVLFWRGRFLLAVFALSIWEAGAVHVAPLVKSGDGERASSDRGTSTTKVSGTSTTEVNGTKSAGRGKPKAATQPQVPRAPPAAAKPAAQPQLPNPPTELDNKGGGALSARA